MTAKELIENTISELRSIMVPAEFLDQIGPPLSRSLGNLKIYLQALENAEIMQKETEEKAKEESETMVSEDGEESVETTD